MLLSVGVYSQIDTADVYRTSRHVPFWQSRNVEKLTTALAKNCSSDEEMVLAFSYWICKNLKLDYSAMEKRPAESKTLKKVLRSRKALSDGYVKLFVEMCKSQKIPAIYVPGYTKDYDYMPGDTLYRAEYAWALVKLSEEWYIMDLAAASSKVVAVVSPMSKLLWTLFNVPYASHLMAVREFNPTYLYMDPIKNVSKHMPVVDEFQLLQYPMSISYYMVGDTLMQSYLERYPEKNQTSEVLNSFSSKTAMEKYTLVADRSEESNPVNKYTKALYYYYALKNFYNTYYIQEKGKIFAPLEESEKVWNYSKIADSLFV
ncbi:MAG: transglutaminase domain-containing protein, partial [Bacteroidales bacterium]|nr:transglutaminase domain-containing protein [Bacteroidales bacterium]